MNNYEEKLMLLEQAKIIIEMGNNSDINKIKTLRNITSLQELYFMCCNTNYIYADELLESYSDESPKEILQYRISLKNDKDLLNKYKEKYGEDEFYNQYLILL